MLLLIGYYTMRVLWVFNTMWVNKYRTKCEAILGKLEATFSFLFQNSFDY